MSAQLTPKCPYCGSFYLSTMDGEKKKRCIDCHKEFSTDNKQVEVKNREKEWLW